MNEEQQEPLFRLEDHWPDEMGMIPCWGRRKECALYPGDEIRLFGTTRSRSRGCGDCDIFQSRRGLFERIARRDEREDQERRRQWWLAQQGEREETEEELLRRLDAEREEEDTP